VGFVNKIASVFSHIHPILSAHIKPYAHEHSFSLTTTALELIPEPHALQVGTFLAKKITSVAFLQRHNSSAALQTREETKQVHSLLFFGLF
jgi:hypothetical protein